MRKAIHILISVLIFVITPVITRAQHVSTAQPSSAEKQIPTSALTEFRLDTLAKTYVYFRHDIDRIDSNYSDNRAALASIRQALTQIDADSLNSISSIIVEGASSPLGHPTYNLLLSYRRAQTVEKFLRTIPGLKNFDIRTVATGENWNTFTEDIRSNYRRRNRKELLEILDDSSTADEVKKSLIRKMEPDSLTWRILIRDYMSSSRHAVVVVVVRKERIIDAMPEGPVIRSFAVTQQVSSIATPPSEKKVSESVPSEEIKSSAPKTPVFSLRSNLLVPLLNAGVEVPLGNRWSVAADYYYPWFWPNQKNKNCFEILGWSVEGRYWFGRGRQSYDRLKGHSVGVYMAGGYYDFEKNYRGMQGEFVSPGIDYTYSMSVGKAKRVHLQFTLALGYIRSWGTTYNVYGDYGALYPDDGRVIWDYFGPTKAAVSIVVPFYRKEDRR